MKKTFVKMATLTILWSYAVPFVVLLALNTLQRLVWFPLSDIQGFVIAATISAIVFWWKLYCYIKKYFVLKI